MTSRILIVRIENYVKFLKNYVKFLNNWKTLFRMTNPLVV